MDIEIPTTYGKMSIKCEHVDDLNLGIKTKVNVVWRCHLPNKAP